MQVALRNVSVLGFVSRSVPKPVGFETKVIEKAFSIPPLPSVLVGLAPWLSAYYPAGLGVVGQQFLPRSLPLQSLTPNPPDECSTTDTELPPLTLEQRKVIERIQEPNTYLLHGETGSGKTRVYIELTRQTLQHGRSAIILTPEIALTPQLERSFKTVFRHQVVVTHSHLTESARRKIWLQILSAQEPLIVIGPRSALFSPLRNIGLIVMDESHEPSYKQEQSPHYLTSRVAAKLASLSNAVLVLGSATPTITDYFVATQRQKPILRMHAVAKTTTAKPSVVQIVDLRDRSHFTKKPHLSDKLIAVIKASLQVGEQSLLFLNRRGTARLIICEQCGWQAACKHCNLPLTYHGDDHAMRCHTCGRSWPAISSCPTCHSSNVLFRSIGTKAIYNEVSATFPEARIQRFDADNKKSERIEQHYEAVRSGQVDILIGTQILAKGLDLPNLSVVGVIAADTSLYFPDYTASERTYQLLRQVIGRVGRGHRDGHVIIQTYTPENNVIQAAANSQWSNFYEQELSERKQFLFPPFCHLLKLTYQLTSNAAAEQKAKKFVELLRATGIRVKIEGPAPSTHEKVNGKYEWQIVLKATQRSELLKAIAILPSGWSYDLDPINLL